MANSEPDEWDDLPPGGTAPNVWDGSYWDGDQWEPDEAAALPPPAVTAEITPSRLPGPSPVTVTPQHRAAPATEPAPAGHLDAGAPRPPSSPAVQGTSRRTVLLACLLVSVIAFAIVYLGERPGTATGTAGWRQAHAAPSPTPVGGDSSPAREGADTARADPDALVEFCRHAPSAAETIACITTAVDAGAVDPARIPALYRFPECGLAGPLLDATVTRLDDAAFVELVTTARTCFDGRVADGSMTPEQMPFEVAAPACYGGINPFRLGTAEFEQRLLAYRSCVLGG